MESVLVALAAWLDAIGLRQWATSGAWVYPVANVVHVLGLVFLVGAIGIVDLRIVGLWPRLPLKELSRALTPIGATGLAMQLASGVVLFAADGAALAGSRVFQIKLLLMALALANAAAFRWRWQALGDGRGFAGRASARLAALASLALWVTIAIAGRMIAYT